jgi:hypothetical protein
VGGVYGEIDSRADFERVVQEARVITRGILKVQPLNPIIENIDTQLDALERWTANGREPTPAERQTISVGIIAVRELDDVPDPQIKTLVQKLFAIDSYVKEWPTDDQAAAATDADFWKRYGL